MSLFDRANAAPGFALAALPVVVLFAPLAFWDLMTVFALYAAHQRFGAGKIAAKPKDEGVRVSKEIVHALMPEMGLSGIRTKAKAIYMARLRQTRNIVMRNFDVSAPNMT